MTTSSNSNDPIVLIPLGGLGQRFTDEGHSSPKPLIKALGDPILYWLLNSLNINTRSSSSSSNHVRCVLIPYHPDLGKFRFEDRLRKDFPNIPFVFVPLTGNTMGAADTMRIALQSLGLDFSDSPIISLDGDNFYTIDLLSMWIGKESLDNCLVTFDDDGDKPIYSYVRLGENDDDRNKRNKIVEIKEKVKISNQACTGAYGFSSWKQLLQYSLKTLSNPANKQKNEFYISSVIALMIHAGEIFETLRVPIDVYVCLGTPLQLRAFCNDFPRRAIGSYSYNAEMQQRLTSNYLTDAHAPPPPQHPQLAESQWMQRYQQSPEGLAVSNNKCKPNPQFSSPTSACVVYVGLSYMPKRVATDEHAPAYDLDYVDCGAWENHRTNITDSLARMGIATPSFVMATNANPRHSHFCSLLSADPTHIDAVSPEDEASWIKNWAGGYCGETGHGLPSGHRLQKIVAAHPLVEADVYIFVRCDVLLKKPLHEMNLDLSKINMGWIEQRGPALALGDHFSGFKTSGRVAGSGLHVCPRRLVGAFVEAYSRDHHSLHWLLKEKRITLAHDVHFIEGIGRAYSSSSDIMDNPLYKIFRGHDWPTPNLKLRLVGVIQHVGHMAARGADLTRPPHSVLVRAIDVAEGRP